jgi:serine/threonine protein kinase/Flp pilus assembly protein TadD
MTALADPVPTGSRSDHALARVVEQVTARIQAGEVIDAARLDADYPEHAERLRLLLPAIQLLADASRPDGPPLAVPVGAGVELASSTLGDFRLIREIGRGCMGVVYEAEQVSLGRRVALKVLPFAGALDPRQLQRFKNEAQAAAHLHHTNIVPVYYVGCDRGVHYYAMQLIEGETLAAVIRQLRRREKGPQSGAPNQQPAIAEGAAQILSDPLSDQASDPAQSASKVAQIFGDKAPSTGPVAGLTTEPSTRTPAYLRQVATLGIQAAQALEHAHQMGVVHRDIKPGNLLLDPRGNLWVTDFGLAQFNAEANLTLTGDLLGTLRYMSPEQAASQRSVIDHRTDVYSLGVTLYELLTLEPAVTGTDRPEILRQIVSEDPRPPRRINAAVPPELDTIVRKAVEKNPADRYATAKELADDLERFLKHEPIRARRASLVHRSRKWCRRHRSLVAGAAVLASTTFVLASGWAWSYQSDLTHRRAATERGVNAALVEAETLTAQGWTEVDDLERWQATTRLAQAALSRAEELLSAGVVAGELSERLREVRTAVDETVRANRLCTALDNIRLGAGAAVNVKESRFERSAVVPLYDAAFRQYGLDLNSAERAAALVRGSPFRRTLLGALDDWLQWTDDPGQRQRLIELLRMATADTEPYWERWRSARDGQDVDSLAAFARDPQAAELPPATITAMARRLQVAGRPDEAEILLRAGQERYPNDFWISHNLGLRYRKAGKLKAGDALRFLSVAQALRPKNPGVGFNLAQALADAGDIDAAIRGYQRVIELAPEYGAAHRLLANKLHFSTHDLDGAVRHYRKAIEYGQTHPDVYYNLGVALLEKGDAEQAGASFRTAITVKPEFWEAHINLGYALAKKGEPNAAIISFREGLRLNPKYVPGHVDLGLALQQAGDLEGAGRCFRDAIQLDPKSPHANYDLARVLRELKDLDGAIRCYRTCLESLPNDAQMHYELGNALADNGDPEGAIECYRRALDIEPRHAECNTNLANRLLDIGKTDEATACYRAALEANPKLIQAYMGLGSTLRRKGDLDEAMTCYRKALELEPDFPEAHCKLGKVLADKGRFADAVTELKRGHELGGRKPGWSFPSAQWVREAELMAILSPQLPALLSGERKLSSAEEELACAAMCVRKKLYSPAVRFYREAFQADPNCAGTHRYDAACAAAMAGCGHEADAEEISNRDRTGLRKQALEWLCADLVSLEEQWHTSPDKARVAVAKSLRRWQHDTEFAAVRADGLALLSEAEQMEWRTFWAEVQKLRAEVDAKRKKHE